MRKFLSIVQVVLIVILVASGSVIFYRHTQEESELRMYDDCRIIYRQNYRPDQESSDDEKEKTSHKEELGIDFIALNEVNEDVVGWITIPGTKIDYPIVQGRDNSYYLDHAYNNKDNSLGSIFMDCKNMPDFSDSNTVIYGHYLSKDKTAMFSQLNNFLDEKFWKGHKKFFVYTEDGKQHSYMIFSVYLTGSTSISFNTDIDSMAFPVFLSTASEKSWYRTGIYPNSDSKVVTLVCCYEKDFSQRIVVHGMKIS